MAIGLYEHQKRAVGLLRSGSVLCGGVGTGKSLTALAYYIKSCGGTLATDVSPAKPLKRRKPLYIITTARKRDTGEWDEECLKVGLKTHLTASEGPFVTIDSWNNIKKYTDVKNAFFIFDEQRVVGKGAWVKAFLKITRQNKWILLTATPGDQWIDYIPVFIANGYYRNRTQFIREHVVYAPMSKFPKIVRYLNTKKLERLRRDIIVPMTYEKKASLHDIWMSVRYDKALYDKVYKDRWNPYDDKPIENISQYCYIQRRIVNTSQDRLDKLTYVLKHHGRVILFYNFDSELEMLREFAKKHDIFTIEWNGHKHETIPDDKSKWLYLVQYNAGAEGWNCTQTNCIVFFSLTYSYKTFAQARGRIDRLNTPYQDLYYYEFYSKSPIDRAIRGCLDSKEDFNERTFALANKSQPIMEGIG